MNHTILDDIRTIKQLEKRIGKQVPQPLFLFVENYGRTLDDILGDIAKEMGKSDAFVFNTGKYAENNPRQYLECEMKKRAELGKSYNGCVLINLTGGLDVVELHELVQFALERQDELVVLFSVNSKRLAQRVEKVLETYVYVRVVEAEAFSEKEQLCILEEQWNEFGIKLLPREKKKIKETLSKHVWDESDRVRTRLSNLAMKVAYEKIFSGNTEPDNYIESSFEIELNSTEKEPKKRQIGFVLEG